MAVNNKIIKIDDVEGAVYEIDEWKVIYESEMLVKPIIGNEYHLYQRMDDNENGNGRFMSLISKEEWEDLDKWKISYIGTFKQDSRQKWIHIKIADRYEEIDDE